MLSGPVKNICLLIILVLWPGPAVFSAPAHRITGQFLVIENPAALKIYNKYEQRISAQELSLFKPYCALRLTGINLTLSDNFTLADRIELNGETFYLLKTNRKMLDTSQHAGYLKEFNGVVIIEDTVEIRSGNSIHLQIPAPAAGKISLPAGSSLRRIFTSGRLTYVQLLDQTGQFGWCNLPARGAWRKFRQPVTAANLHDIFGRIQPVFERYNSLYHQSFQYFNSRSAVQKTIPYWQVELKGQLISAELRQVSDLQFFQNSMPYLVNEIQQQLYNTSLQITRTDGGIEIK